MPSLSIPPSRKLHKFNCAEAHPSPVLLGFYEAFMTQAWHPSPTVGLPLSEQHYSVTHCSPHPLVLACYAFVSDVFPCSLFSLKGAPWFSSLLIQAFSDHPTSKRVPCALFTLHVSAHFVPFHLEPFENMFLLYSYEPICTGFFIVASLLLLAGSEQMLSNYLLRNDYQITV